MSQYSGGRAGSRGGGGGEGSWINRMDRDGDGKIGADEWRRYHRGTPTTGRSSLLSGVSDYGRKNMCEREGY